MNQEALKKLKLHMEAASDALIDCTVVAGDLFEDEITEDEITDEELANEDTLDKISAEIYRINRAMERFKKFVEDL